MRMSYLTWWAACALCCFGCGASDSTLEPGALGARDLLGIAPDVAVAWSAGERSQARAVLEAAVRPGAEVTTTTIEPASEVVWAVVDGLELIDRQRRADGLDALVLTRVELEGSALEALEVGPLDFAPPPAPSTIEPVGWDGADLVALVATRPHVVRALVEAAGVSDVRWVEPAPQASFGAAVVVDRQVLLVNPVLLAAAEPMPVVANVAAPAGDPSPASAGGAGPTALAPPEPEVSYAGNPYSFFGSVAECAAAQRGRCEACLPSTTCVAESRDAADGNAECQTLGENDGIGYYLFCANLALAIATVEECVGGSSPAGCAPVSTASNQLVALEANRAFVDDEVCRGGLDSCLSTIFGRPGEDYPPFADAGPQPPQPPPPRDVSPGCGDTDVNCAFSPQCDATCGDTNCSNAVECDNGCDDSQSGSSGGCGGDSSGGGSGGGCGGDSGGGSGGGGCGSDSGGGGCDGCGGGDSGGGGGCDGCGGGDSGGGGDCGGCGGGGSSGGGDCGGDCSSGGGGGSSSCNVARNRPLRLGTIVGIGWALLPLPLLTWLRRRESKRSRSEVAS